MKEYFDCLIMTHGTAFGVGAAIFLLTILLVARRVVGFVLSVILMLIAIGASWAINNESFVRTYLDKWIPTTQTSSTRSTPATPVSTPTQAPTTTSRAAQDQAVQQQQSSQAVSNSQRPDNLKGQIDAQKSRVQGFLDESSPDVSQQQK